MSRFQQLFKDNKKYYIEGSPVILEASALQKDTQEDKVLAQIKIRNIDEKTISACKVNIECYEVNGEDMIDTIVYSYLDLYASRGAFFGTKVPVYVPNNTRKIIVNVKEIVFNDGSLWTSDVKAEEIPEPTTLFSFLKDNTLVDEYKRLSSSDGNNVPKIYKDLFICSCGTINKKDSRCYECSHTYESLNKYFDISLLITKRNERVKKEKEDEEARILKEQEIKAEEERLRKIEEERQKTEKIKKEKLYKKIAIITAIVAVLSFGSYYLVSGIIQPYMQKLNDYTSAIELFNEGKYIEANEAFINLTDFKDSAEKASEALYLRAEKLSNDKKYNEAYTAFLNLGEYKDSKERADACKDTLYSNDYNTGIKNCDEGNYKDGLALLEKCTGYKDAEDLVKFYSYRYGKELYDNQDYKKASKYFLKLKGYEDADALYLDSMYNHANKCMNNSDYLNAVDTFIKIKDYKDSEEKIDEAKYLYIKKYPIVKAKTTYRF